MRARSQAHSRGWCCSAPTLRRKPLMTPTRCSAAASVSRASLSPPARLSSPPMARPPPPTRWPRKPRSTFSAPAAARSTRPSPRTPCLALWSPRATASAGIFSSSSGPPKPSSSTAITARAARRGGCRWRKCAAKRAGAAIPTPCRASARRAYPYPARWMAGLRCTSASGACRWATSWAPTIAYARAGARSRKPSRCIGPTTNAGSTLSSPPAGCRSRQRPRPLFLPGELRADAGHAERPRPLRHPRSRQHA